MKESTKVRLLGVNPDNPWPVTKEHQAHMQARQADRMAKPMTKAEKWFYEGYLKDTGYKWKRERRWGFRLFDFWNARVGIAIEVDGPEHDRNLDFLKEKI